MTSHYTYQFRQVKGVWFIMIEDQDQGGATVTNNIDAVVKGIAKKEQIEPVEFRIIYKDSEGYWDGYHFSNRQFYAIRERHWLKAAVKTINQ